VAPDIDRLRVAERRLALAERDGRPLELRPIGIRIEHDGGAQQRPEIYPKLLALARGPLNRDGGRHGRFGCLFSGAGSLSSRPTRLELKFSVRSRVGSDATRSTARYSV